MSEKVLASGIHEGTYALGFTGGSLGGAYLVSVAGIRTPFEIGIAVLLSIMVVQFLARALGQRADEAGTGRARAHYVREPLVGAGKRLSSPFSC